MNATLSQTHLSTVPMSTLSRWLQHFGIALSIATPEDEPHVDGAMVHAHKEDLRRLRKEASRRSERPPLTFA